MSDHTTPAAAEALPQPVAVGTISVKQVLPWLIFAALLAVIAVYFVSAEQGATSLLAGNAVHEWFHDGRHLLGFPCH